MGTEGLGSLGILVWRVQGFRRSREFRYFRVREFMDQGSSFGRLRGSRGG